MTRWQVTADERLHYSRAKLAALSALRLAGLPEDGLLAGKVKQGCRRVYLLTNEHGEQVAFPSLKAISAYANERRLHAESMAALPANARFSWAEWQADGPARTLALLYARLRAHPTASGVTLRPAAQQPDTPARCTWPGCSYPATGSIDQRAYCAGHAYIYHACQQAQGAA